MPKLLDQITIFDTELQHVINGSEHQIALDEYQLISAKLSAVQVKLVKLNLYNDVLLSNSKEFESLTFNGEEKQQLNDLNFSFQSLITSWNELDYKLRHANDNFFSTTLSLLDSVMTSIKTKYESLWSIWISELRNSFEVSDELLETQKTIHHLAATHADFIKTREQFNQVTMSLPEHTSTIKIIKGLAEKLNSLYNQMELKLPEGVKKLFKELSKGFGNNAPISFLTPEVLTWLEDNNETGNFVVKRR